MTYLRATNSVDLTELREFSLLTESNDSWGDTPHYTEVAVTETLSTGLFNVHL